MTDCTQARKNMVDCQITTNGVIDPHVIEAFETLPREKFNPSGDTQASYRDEDIFLDDGQRVLIEPFIHARMVQALAPQKDEIALDIGGSYGYSAAILSSMVTTVLALESEQSYIDKATELWASMDETCNIAGLVGDLAEGASRNAPYDLIFVNGAVEYVPESWKNQLSVGGRMIVTIKAQNKTMGDVTLIEALGNAQFSSHVVLSAATPYLKGFEPKKSFVF